MIEKILLKSFGSHGNKPVNTDDDETAAVRAASWLQLQEPHLNPSRAPQRAPSCLPVKTSPDSSLLVDLQAKNVLPTNCSKTVTHALWTYSSFNKYLSHDTFVINV